MKAATAGDHQVSDVLLRFICTVAFNLPSTLEGSERSRLWGVQIKYYFWCILEAFPDDITLNHLQTGSNSAARKHYPNFIKRGTEAHEALRHVCTGRGSYFYKAEQKRGSQVFLCHTYFSVHRPSSDGARAPTSLSYHFCLTGHGPLFPRLLFVLAPLVQDTN